MKINVEITGTAPEKKIDLEKVRKTVRIIAGKKFRGKGRSVNILFVSDSRIRSLNKKYLGHDRVTDVLAFPSGDGCEAILPKSFPGEKGHVGDIVIAPGRAARNAGIYNVSFGREIVRYVAHGMMHLAGYDDNDPCQRMEMTKEEDIAIEKVFGKARTGK